MHSNWRKWLEPLKASLRVVIICMNEALLMFGNETFWV